ncbi:hypothetical protein DSO57_1004898 [Entomophthora muscae]|uniref:Uncharacterized protein n=1 Tax=Entomophthora muscae TaxID=34485 RepID=A0ACC2TVH5_9FUNG|nr:hypothetical protein DSO57_1004898 [Entomophthora muscae]
MWEFNNLMNKGNLIETPRSQKKAPKSQITKVYQIMLDLLQWDSKLPLTQVQKQLAHHGIWVSEHMLQLWMYGKVTLIRILTNVAGNQWYCTEDSVGFLSTSPQSVSWIVARDRLEGIVIL